MLLLERFKEVSSFTWPRVAAVGTTLRDPRVRVGAVVVAIAGLVLFGHAASYDRYFVDDSFISLRYSWRLLHGQGLNWTAGEHVEGYSNFLWVVLVALGGIFGGDLITVARFFCFVATLAVMAALAFAYPSRSKREALAPLVGSLLVAFAAPSAAWAIGGLEGPLLTALVCWGLVLLYPIVDAGAALDWFVARPAGIMLALAALTRPDGALFGVTAAFALLLVGGLRFRLWRAAATILIVIGAAVTLQLLFRRLYYADWFPNTYYAKVALTEQRRREGLEYLVSALPFLGSLPVLGLLSFVWGMFDGSSRRRVVIVAAPLVAWSAYLVMVGGDMISGRRHWVPIIALCALLATELFSRLVKRPRLRIAFAVIGPAALLFLIRGAIIDPQRENALHDDWNWAGREVGETLQTAFAAKDPLVAVDAAGALPYFAEKLRMLDMLGLSDAYLARHRPAEMGRGLVGHELGDGAYLWRRKPDVLLFHDSYGRDEGAWRGGAEMYRMPDFRRFYQLIVVDTPPPKRIRSVMWVRKEDGPIGILRRPADIEIPGYLVNEPRENVTATIGPHGVLGSLIEPHVNARITGVSIPRGRWQIRLTGTFLERCVVRVTGPSRPFSYDEGDHWVVEVESDDAMVDVNVEVPERTHAHVESIKLHRIN